MMTSAEKQRALIELLLIDEFPDSLLRKVLEI